MSGRIFLACVFVVAVAACEGVQDLGSHEVPGDGAGDGGGDGSGGTVDGGGTSPSDAGDDDVAAPVDSGHEGKFLFVTDNRYTGDLRTEGGAASGLAGADAICNMEASAAGIGGVFKAWLSTATENAKDRIAPVGPWRLVDDTVIFPGKAVVGFPLRYPRVTAKGHELFASDAPEVWTGTSSDGTVISGERTCAGWTSGVAADRASYGIVVSTNGEWTQYQGLSLTTQTGPCSARLRLYCFEQ